MNAPTDMSWPTALVTIVFALCALARFWWRMRAAERAADATIRGVEKGGDPRTKALIQSEALKAGAEGDLRERVRRVTGKIPPRGSGPPLALLCLALAVLPGCCSLSDADLQLIRTAQAVNLGHSRDASLPPEARSVALDNYDAFTQLRRSADGTPIPADVRERLGLAQDEE